VSVCGVHLCVVCVCVCLRLCVCVCVCVCLPLCVVYRRAEVSSSGVCVFSSAHISDSEN